MTIQLSADGCVKLSIKFQLSWEDSFSPLLWACSSVGTSVLPVLYPMAKFAPNQAKLCEIMDY